MFVHSLVSGRAYPSTSYLYFWPTKRDETAGLFVRWFFELFVELSEFGISGAPWMA
jgi:hypothetical protein